MIFAIDHGNAQIKTLNHVFTSGVKRHSILPEKGVEYVYADGAYYTLSGESAPYKEDKTSDDLFRVLTQFALGRETRHLKKNEFVETIRMGCDLPIEHYSLNRERFADYFRGKMEFQYCGVPYQIDISDVYVVPQGYAAAKAYQSKLGLQDYSVAIIIDGGGYDWDICILNEGKLNYDYFRSMDMGVIRYKSSTINYIQKAYGYKIMGSHIDAVLEDKKTVLSEAIKKDIKDLAEEHARTFLNSVRQDGWDIRSSPTFFFGGAPLYFKKYFDGLSDNSVTFIDDIKANALGVYKLSKNHFTRKDGWQK